MTEFQELKARAEAIGVPDFESIRSTADLQAAVDAREAELALTSAAPGTEPTVPELLAMINQLRIRTEAAEAAAAARAPAVGGDLEQQRADAAEAFAGWPREGYDGPHPWEVAQLHVEARHVGAQPEVYLGPGAITHTMPSLTTGAGGAANGEDVRTLVELLRTLGYKSNTGAKGENPNWILDTSIMNDVQAFARANGVSNDPQEFNGLSQPAHEYVDRVVGPYIWQALFTAAARRESELAAA